MTRLILIFAAIFTVYARPSAQPDSTVFLDSNTPVILRLTGHGQPAEAVFEGEQGQIITLVAQAVDPTTVDLVLEIVIPSGERLAYNDSWLGEGTNLTPPIGFESLAVSDAVLSRLILPDSGTYTVRLNTFNGEGVGDATLTLMIEPVGALILGEVYPLGLHRAEIGTVTLALSAGEKVSMTALAQRGRLDPWLELTNPAGEILAANDDHGTTDLSLNVFDSRLTFTAETDGIYTVRVREFLGRAGTIHLLAEVSP